MQIKAFLHSHQGFPSFQLLWCIKFFTILFTHVNLNINKNEKLIFHKSINFLWNFFCGPSNLGTGTFYYFCLLLQLLFLSWLIRNLFKQTLTHSHQSTSRMVKNKVYQIHIFPKWLWVLGSPWGALEGCSSSIEPLLYPYWDPLAGEPSRKNNLSIAPVATMYSKKFHYYDKFVWCPWLKYHLGYYQGGERES
jgi:hypothetical protein